MSIGATKRPSAWRNQTHHRDSQREGGDRVFLDYRIQVVNVIRD